MSIAKSLFDFKNLRLLYRTDVRLGSLTLTLHRCVGIFLVVASLLSFSTQFFGEPINCLVSSSGVKGNERFFHQYCWLHGTFTIDESDTQRMAHPGVATNQGQKFTKHTYYQWVPIVLSFQAFAFYLPCRLWKYLEGGRLSNLLKLDKSDDKDESTLEYIRHPLVRILREHTGTNIVYAIKYLGCEVLALINLILQMVLMDVFFQGEFSQLGVKILKHDYGSENSDYSDPLISLFPRLTKCNLKWFSVNGNMNLVDGLCLLSLNIINEKIYLILWCLLMFLCVWTVLHVLVLVVLYFNKTVRGLLLKRRVPGIANHIINPIIRASAFGDWLILIQLSDNLDPMKFRCVLEGLARELRHKPNLDTFHRVRNSSSSSDEMQQKQTKKIGSSDKEFFTWQL